MLTKREDGTSIPGFLLPREGNWIVPAESRAVAGSGELTRSPGHSTFQLNK